MRSADRVTRLERDHVGSEKGAERKEMGWWRVRRVKERRSSAVALRRDDPTAAIRFAWGRHERERVPVRPFGNNWRRETAD